MNNSFNILWFEDNKTWYKMACRNVEQSLQKHYLKSNIQNENSKETFNVSILLSNKYDLILMDYKLIDGTTGDQIISEIRKANILTDILFYSSDEKGMNNAVKEAIPDIDGIYITKREHSIFSKKVELLISKIVRRSEDIVNLRGMVLDATSNFELITKEFLSKLWKSTTQEKRACLNKIVNEKILNHYKDFIETTSIQFNNGETDFEKLNNQPGLFSMNDRLTIISEFCKETDIELKLNDKDFKDYYTKQLSSFRNKLGHVSVGEEIKVNGKIYVIDEAFHQMLRKNINELENEFEPALNKLL